MEQENEDLELLPDAIIERLRRNEQSLSVITPMADRTVLAEAKSHFASRGQGRRRRVSGPVWGAIAATVVVGIFLMDSRRYAPVSVAPTEADIDRSGRVDIVDVLSLARMREQDPAAVSQAQIDALAMQIVSLDTKGDAS